MGGDKKWYGSFVVRQIHRGSYMSEHVLLNLLYELGKRDKMQGLPSILSLFRNEINKFNNTRIRILETLQCPFFGWGKQNC